MAVSPDPAGFARALSESIKASGMSRRQVADRAGNGCSESTLGNWLAQRGQPDLYVVSRVEDALGLPAGSLTRFLGFVPAGEKEPGVVEAIMKDRVLWPEARRSLIGLYRLLASRAVVE